MQQKTFFQIESAIDLRSQAKESNFFFNTETMMKSINRSDLA